MKYTNEQTLIMDVVPSLLAEGTSIIIEARAGAGKTFILTEIANDPALPIGGRCLAFNRAIADELADRLPASCPSSTFHSLGFALLRDRLQTCKSNPRKISDLVKKHIKPKGVFAKPYSELISAMKTNGLGLPGLPPITDESMIELIDYRDIELPKDTSEAEFLTNTKRLFKKSLAETAIIDFDDMLYLPLHLAAKYGWKYDQYPYLMIDEAQDVSPLRLALIRSLTSTVLAVGDPYQAIYAFAGAAFGALDIIATDYAAQAYSLTESFRCPIAICTHASDLIAPAQILPMASADEGFVRRQAYDPGWFPTTSSIAVLCRTNQPLFVMALSMLRARQPMNFRSDFPRQLISFMKRFKATSCVQLRSRLTEWFEETEEKLLASGRKGALAMAHDKYSTLMYLSTECEDPKNIELTLNDLLYPTKGAPTLSTIHKAKGLEWPHIKLLRSDLLPAPWIAPDDIEAMQQEVHLEYVAVTRAIGTFTYLDHPSR